MANDYFKSYPELMAGKTVMYIHGFGSSAQSGTVAMLRQLMPQARVVAEDMPLHPEEALALLHQMVEREKPHLIIGTSMGGMYAEQLKGIHRILVNPAFEMARTMPEHGLTGRQEFHNPRADGVQEFFVTKAVVKEYVWATEQCFQNVTPEERHLVYGLFGNEDTTVDTRDMFLARYPQAVGFHGGHRLTDKIVLHYLAPVIRWIDDEQEGRQREVVYIDINTMFDAYGRATSSMHKAYEMLIEHYDVRIVCPAPSTQPSLMLEQQQKVTDLLSAPCHDRMVFTNQPQQLYGDFFISATKHSNLLATLLHYGSDEMKTWEEIITYFSRII